MNEIPLYGKVEEVLAPENARGDLKPGTGFPAKISSWNGLVSAELRFDEPFKA
jgi:hypothetical protein